MGFTFNLPSSLILYISCSYSSLFPINSFLCCFYFLMLITGILDSFISIQTCFISFEVCRTFVPLIYQLKLSHFLSHNICFAFCNFPSYLSIASCVVFRSSLPPVFSHFRYNCSFPFTLRSITVVHHSRFLRLILIGSYKASLAALSMHSLIVF